MSEENQNVSSKESFITPQDPSFMQYRLDTTDLIKQVEVSLTGKVTHYIANDDGDIIEKSKQIAEPKVNDEGFTAIINYLKAHVNNQTVQGNLNEDQYNSIVADVREDFSSIVIINIYKCNIKNSDYDYIVNTVLDVIKLFLSRTLNNKERESYNTMRESMQMSSTSKGWGVR